MEHVHIFTSAIHQHTPTPSRINNPLDKDVLKKCGYSIVQLRFTMKHTSSFCDIKKTCPIGFYRLLLNCCCETCSLPGLFFAWIVVIVPSFVFVVHCCVAFTYRLLHFLAVLLRGKVHLLYNVWCFRLVWDDGSKSWTITKKNKVIWSHIWRITRFDQH